MADRTDWFSDLEAELRALGRELDVPAAPDLTADVRRRLAQPVRRSRIGWRIAVPVVLALLTVLVATPQGRAVITHVFRFAGVELREERGSVPTPATSAPLSGERRMSLDQARRQVAFPILVPATLGAPDEVVVSDRGRIASLVYRGTPYGEVRLDEFDGRLDPIYLKKFVDPGEVTWTQIAGRRALWLRGPHEVVYVRRGGEPDAVSARLTTGNTLIWDTGRVVLRLEGNVDRAQAEGIAGSAR